MSDHPVAEQYTSEDAPEVEGGIVGQTSKPRARLGPTEVVTLPASDSEDDDEDEERGEGEGEEQDPDFLSTYPDDTEVIHALSGSMAVAG